MKLYQIDYINSFGEVEFVGLTDNPDKWLKENNEQRVGDGNEPEDLDDFEIFEVDTWIYNQEKKERIIEEIIGCALCDINDIKNALGDGIKDMPKDSDGTEITIGNCIDDVIKNLEDLRNINYKEQL